MADEARRLPSGMALSPQAEAKMLADFNASWEANRPRQRTGSAGMLVWYAVHTKARAEFVLAEVLKQQRYGLVMPRERVMIRTAHERNVVVERPLFPRYLFVQIGKDEPIADINNMRGVSTIVHAPNAGPVPIPQGVIDDVLAIGDGNGLVKCAVAEYIRVGEEFRIKLGPFEGFIAAIDRVDGDAIRAFVRVFGRETPVKLEAHQLGEKVRACKAEANRHSESPRRKVTPRRV